MESLELTILERMNKEDSVKACRMIGEVKVKGLPNRPSGKTKLSVTLSIAEEGGMVRGVVEDLGFGDEFQKSGFKAAFEPERFKRQILE